MNVALSLAMDPVEDERDAIVRGLGRRDSDLLDLLIERSHHRLMRYLVHLTGSHETAEDVFQETWLRVIERSGQYNGSSKFETWLFAIARHLVIDRSRKRRRSGSQPWSESDWREEQSETSQSEPNPFDVAADHEEARHIAGAVSRLAPFYREVLFLRFQEDMKLNEIASVVGAPLSTVKARLYRALDALRSSLGEAQA
jgi:RNA polymerase sigma-70 factor (ECF subfamily)